MKNTLVLLLVTFTCISSYSQSDVVNIPDDNFRNALLNINGIDTNTDGKIQVTEANSYKGFLNVASKRIKDLTDIEAFTQATHLWCNRNQLKTLDVSKNTALTKLFCQNNQLTSLDVSNLKNLIWLYAYSNRFSTIDVSKNLMLETLQVHNNILTYLNIKNGKNSILTNFNALNNNNISCIKVDNAVTFKETWKTKISNLNAVSTSCSNPKKVKKITVLSVSGRFWITAKGQILRMRTNILPSDATNKAVTWSVDQPKLASISSDGVLTPKLDGKVTVRATAKDGSNVFGTTVVAISNHPPPPVVKFTDPKLKAALLPFKLKINTNGDNEVQVSEAQAFRGTISITRKGITNMTGIEAFINLDALYCSFNKFPKLDLSKNTKLRILDCSYNSNLTSLTLNQKINKLICTNNRSINSLDASRATKIIDMNIRLCPKLNTLNLSKNVSLQKLTCSSNNLTSLDITNNPNLDLLKLAFNKISKLDLSKNVKLKRIDLGRNKITSIDISNNLMLEELGLAYCPITGRLDLSKHKALKRLELRSTKLERINIKNGKNTIITKFNATKIPSLTCLQVDDVKKFKAKFGNRVDNPAIISEACFSEVKVNKINVTSVSGRYKITTSGKTLTMKAVVLPANATNKAFKWSVDKDNLATISTKGVLTPKANGSVTVTATAQDGSNTKGKRVVTINISKIIKVNKINVTSASGRYKITEEGKTLTMKTEVLPANATNKTYKWSVDKDNLASISTSGVLSPKANGSVTVTATAQDGSNTKGKRVVTINIQQSVTSIDDNIDSEKIVIYPNPAHDQLNISTDKTIRHIIIKDLLGKAIRVPSNDKVIDISELTHGQYIIQIATDQEVITRKFLKEK